MQRVSQWITAGFLALVVACCCLLAAAPAHAEEADLGYGQETSADIEVLSLVTDVPAKGMNPSAGNYLTFYGTMKGSVYQNGDTINCTIKVLDSKSKTVYSKTWKNIWPVFFAYNWNAKTKSGYLKNGTYTAVLSLSYLQNGTSIATSEKTAQFKVSTSQPKGAKGLTKRKKIILYSGDAGTDYLAETMLKEAGVKAGMGDDAKVKRIYHYITTKFHHIHYDKIAKAKRYYNLDKLAAKVEKYRKTTDAQVNAGKALYSGWYAGQGWQLERRAGVCDDQAAAFALMCNHVGIEAGVCGGYYKNTGGSKSPHAWNYAVVGGKKYYYDVDVELQNRGKGQGDYYWYKKTLAQCKKNHIFQTGA